MFVLYRLKRVINKIIPRQPIVAKADSLKIVSLKRVKIVARASIARRSGPLSDVSIDKYVDIPKNARQTTKDHLFFVVIAKLAIRQEQIM
jgi:hypothetical protein